MIASFFETRVKALITLGSLATALSGIFGIVYALDSRYAHAMDVTQRLDSMEYNIAKGRLEDKKDQLEAALLVLNLKEKKTTGDTAMIQYYQQQLKAVNQQLANMVTPKPIR